MREAMDDVVDNGHGVDNGEDFDFDGNNVDSQIISAAWSCIHICSGRYYLVLFLMCVISHEGEEME